MSHVLRTNCLLNYTVEGRLEERIEVTERLGRRRKQLLDYLKGERGYCNLKEALDRAVWRTRSGRADGPVVRMMDESGTPIVASSEQYGC
jgi:transposase